MKTSEVLLFGAFVFCVALAALTGAPQFIVAAGATAALLFGCCEESCPRRGYMPGQRKSAKVADDMAFVHKQIELWQWFWLLIAATALLAASFTAFVALTEGWPGATVRCYGIVGPKAVLSLGLSGVLLLYGITIAVGCIQPLKAALQEFSNEYRCCVTAEQNSGPRGEGWVADNQLDWSCAAAALQLQKERNRRLFGD